MTCVKRTKNRNDREELACAALSPFSPVVQQCLLYARGNPSSLKLLLSGILSQQQEKKQFFDFMFLSPVNFVLRQNHSVELAWDKIPCLSPVC